MVDKTFLDETCHIKSLGELNEAKKALCHVPCQY